jgi:outer membrane immunogenic protein
LSLLPLNSIVASKGDTYTGFQYAMGTYSESGLNVNPNAIIGRFGKYLENDFANESRLGFGVGDDTNTISGVNVAIEVDTLFGSYALKHANISDGSSIYGALGFSRGELTVSAPGVSISGDDSGLFLV